jgi:DNA-binding NtrC family response regulator
MNILTFDDKPEISHYIKEYFDDDYDFTTCRTCSKVKQELKVRFFDCYIVDLNAATIGLSDETEEKTQGGLLTGWFLLTEHIWTNDLNGIPKTIIFSDYIAQLKRYINSEDASDDEKKKYRLLEEYKCVVSKSEGMKELERAITSVGQRNDGK